MLLIRDIDIYTPKPRGKSDILIGGDKILAIAPQLAHTELKPLEIIDGSNLIAVPGIIDGHAHIAGAGGEAGPGSRTEGLSAEQLLQNGVTSVVGCLGTDGVTRSVEGVLMKAKALRAKGISAWIYTGAYQVPPPTITGDIARDIAMIDEVIGLGEIAIADHRSSCPTLAEFLRLTAQARIGGMLGAKAGIINLHMGDARDPFRLIRDAVNQSEFKFRQYLPTHCNRNHYIFEDACEYGKNGPIDLTTSSWPLYPELEIKPSTAFARLIKAGVPAENITFSSDAGGSLPHFNENGDLLRLETAGVESIWREVRELTLQENQPLETALLPVTTNPAKTLKLPNKGRISIGADADILLIDKDMSIRHVIARGKMFHDLSIQS